MDFQILTKNWDFSVFSGLFPQIFVMREKPFFVSLPGFSGDLTGLENMYRTRVVRKQQSTHNRSLTLTAMVVLSVAPSLAEKALLFVSALKSKDNGSGL